MNIFEIATALVFLSALFGYINSRYLKLPTTIGMMAVSIVFTISMLAFSFFDDRILEAERELISNIDFSTLLLDGMLSFMLFAGALHTDFTKLQSHFGSIISFATLGTLTSTLLVGLSTFWILPILGFQVPLLLCMLFGALISPTDPIAVLGILRQANAPEDIEINIVGESLFNDGVGVVIFMTLYEIVSLGVGDVTFGNIMMLFVQEVFGGLALGAALGYFAYYFMKRIDDYEVEIIITLAVVMVGTFVAQYFHLSAPLTMVAAGLLIGTDQVRDRAMSERTERYVDMFWELIDMLLNTILFVLIGMEILVLVFSWSYIIAGLIAIPLVMFCRYISLWLPIEYFKKSLGFDRRTIQIMTWGGLRGGISIALALSLTNNMERDLFLMMTYVVVVFSILVQGLSVGQLVKRLYPESKATARKHGH